MKCIFLILFLILMGAGTVQAIELTVCSSGCDYTDIQNAVDNSSSGWKVYVYNGTYTLTVNATTNSHIFVGDKDNFTLEGEGDSTFLNFTSDVVSGGITFNNSSYSRLKNMRTRMYRDADSNITVLGNANIYFNNSNHIVIDGINASRASFIVIDVKNFGSIMENITIVNSKTYEGKIGIGLRGWYTRPVSGNSGYVLINNNTVTETTTGIKLDSMKGSNNQSYVTNNTVYLVSGGIDIYAESNNFTVANNNVYQFQNMGILYYALASYGTVTNNTVHDDRFENNNPQDNEGGINIGYSSNNINISNNIIYNLTWVHAFDVGVDNDAYVDATNNNTISHNTVYNISKSCLILYKHFNNSFTFKDNICLNTSFGLNNTFSESVYNPITLNNILYNSNNKTNITCTNCLEVDPLLVDPPNDFNLTINSFARNNASDGTDIGALQYQAASTTNATTDGFYTQTNGGAWNYSIVSYVNFSGSPGSWINTSRMAHNTTFDTNSSMVNYSAQIPVAASITSVINSIQQIPYKIYERVSS